jgi:hypothetical protein
MFEVKEPKLFEIKEKNSDDYSSATLEQKYKIELVEDWRSKDLLEIKSFVEKFYENILLKNDNELNKGILGFISQFGNGKTFYLNYLYCTVFEKIHETENENDKIIYPVYIDISKYEYLQTKEILLTILIEIVNQLDLIQHKDRKGLSELKNKILKLIPKAMKALSVSALNVLSNDKVIDIVGEISEEFGLNLINSINKEDKFLQELTKIAQNKNLLVIIDNLDRCRPEFVLNLLVILKRLFNVDGMTFILAYDKRQIINLLREQYGVNIDIQSYLKKYISYEYYMPQLKNIQDFTIKLLKINYSVTKGGKIYTALENMGSYSGFVEMIDLLGNIKNEYKVKLMIAYGWQKIYLNTTMSLRKYEQGFMHINLINDPFNDLNSYIFFNLLLYIKSNFPAEYKSINYLLDGFQIYIDPEEKFWSKMTELYKTLIDGCSIPSAYNSFKELFNDETSNKLMKKIYQKLEGTI